MEINFRIVETKTHQVLISKDFDNEDEENGYLIEVSFFEKGIKISQKMNFKEENRRDFAFNDISDRFINQVVIDILKII